MIDSQLDAIGTTVDATKSIAQAAAGNLAPCCSAVDSQLNALLSVVDHLSVSGSCDVTPLVSVLESHCSVIESQLDAIGEHVSNTVLRHTP